MFNDLKFRASAIGQIMTNGRAKSEMGETCKSYLKNLFIEKTYGIRKEFTNKYVEKGLEVEDIPTKGYFYQLQAYMELTGLEDACLAYVLIDTPTQLVEDEKRRLSWKMGMIDSEDPEYLLAVEEIERNHSYSNIPIAKRIKEFHIKKDNQVIESMYSRIKECRTYLNSL